MGGTNTDMGLVTENGNIFQRRNIPTNAYTELEPYVRDMMREVKAMMEEQQAIDGEAVELEGIGIGANLGLYSGVNDPNYKDGLGLGFVAQIGLEFNPSAIPFQFTLDARPQWDVIGHSGFGYGLALGIRYRF